MAHSAPVTSSSHPRLRRVRTVLESAHRRRRDRVTALEGIHLVQSWLQIHGAPLEVVIPGRAGQHPEVLALCRQLTAAPLVLDDALFDTLGTLPSPAPVLAVVAVPEPTWPDTLSGRIVVLDAVQDPANVGAIIRTAAAAGVQRLLTTRGTASCWAPKALRAGMGGQFALAIHEGVTLAEVRERLVIPLHGLIAHGGQPLYGTTLPSECAWVLGSEGEGLSDNWSAALDVRFTIPQSARVESLNVAAAAAVCLFEHLRQHPNLS